MSAKINLIRSIKYLCTSPKGKIDLEKSKQILTDLAKEKQPPADYDIILDFRLCQLNLSTTDLWYLAAELVNHNNAFQDKVAVLTLPGLNFEKAEFFELCSKNRGLDIDVFTDYEDAVQWFYED